MLLLSFLVALLPVPAAFAAVPCASATPDGPTQVALPPSGPRVVLEGLTGAPTVRALEGFATQDPRELGAHLVRFEGLPAPAAATGGDRAELRLTTGERLTGLVARGQGEALDVSLAGDVHARAELDRIVSLAFPARVPASWSAPLEAAKEGDRLFRRKGETLERIDGGVEEFGTEGIKFHDERVGSLAIPWSEVVALFVESGGAKPAPASADARVPVQVDLVDTSRLVGVLVRIDATALTLTRLDGERLALPLAAVALAHVADGRLAFVSDLTPREAVPARPFGDDLGMSWPHQVDASVAGTPLSVAGRTFARGLGVHAPQRLVFDLDGSATSLRGAVGVDDSVLRLASHGSVRFRVRVDGQVRFESPVMSGGDAPVPIVLQPPSLAGARELVLETDATPDSFVADRGDWLQLLLVR